MKFQTPHLEVVKASFDNLDQYRLWRQAWRAHYRALSAEIRVLKCLLANSFRGAKCTPEQVTFNVLHEPRYATVNQYGYKCCDLQGTLLAYRFEARILCEERKDSKPRAAAMWKPRQAVVA